MTALRPPLVAAVFAGLLVALAACSGGDEGAPDGGPTPEPADAFVLYRDQEASVIARNLATGAIFEYPVELESGAVIAVACSGDGSRIALLKQRFDMTTRQLVVAGEGAPAGPFTLPPAVQGIEWSPDGTRIVYTEFDGTANEYMVSVLDVADGETTPLTSGAGVAGSPAWSPDGATIAYSVQDVRGTTAIVHVLDADGVGAPREIEAPEGLLYYDPEWSPDGSTLLVAGQGETETQLYFVDPADGSAEQFTTSSDIYKRRPRYAPDGETIAYTGSIIAATVARNLAMLHQFGIFLLDADGGNERALTADPRDNPGALVDPNLDAFLMGWCLPGPWLDEAWIPVAETPTP